MQTPTNEFYDAIVIGSGYGGSVSAFRLAESGLKVAVLETGYHHKAPNMPRGEESEWNPQEGHYGPHTVNRLSKSVTAWYGTAVGGGSIVNAAVMIRMDNFPNWAGGITRETLNPYYDRAEAMLGARVYPVAQPLMPYAGTIKTKVMLEAAQKLGVPSVTPPVAITYRQPDENIGTIKINAHGAEQQGCRQCGECSLPGCNYQAKNSLDFNYLHAAATRHGAKILPGNKVDKIARMPGGYWEVTTIDPKSGETRQFQARLVVVAAGSVGSSELLLRQKHVHGTLPDLSERLGRQYTSNGTFIGFAIRAKRDLDPSGGPEITAGLDFQGPDGKTQGHLMFDGSFRGFTYETFFVTGRLVGLKRWAIKIVSKGFKLAEKLKLLEPRKTLPLLVIGRDNAVGNFTLNKEGRIQTDLNPQDNASFYRRANEHMRAFTKAMGASFLPFPHWALERKIDVPHNLGGVPMGDTIKEGVVDSYGRVYGYDNLVVLDGSIIPATMGANPALTIAALAERSMEKLLPGLKRTRRVSTEDRDTSVDAAPYPVQAQVNPVIPVTRDMTAQFEEEHFRVQQARMAGKRFALPARMADKVVLFVPGILARHMGNHSKQLLGRLRHIGLSVTPVPVNTDIDTAQNVEMIKDHIRSLPEDAQCILIGHSRGGIMLLDAYRQLGIIDQIKVSRIILIQSPVNGAPVADFVVGKNGLRRSVAWGSRIVFGNNVMDTVRELSQQGRYMAQRALPPLTARDLAKIYTLRSVIGKGDSPSFELMRKLNAKAGQKSDGITPYQLSEILGANDVTLEGYDHEQSVIQEPTRLKRLTGYKANADYESGDVVEALLRMAYRN